MGLIVVLDDIYVDSLYLLRTIGVAVKEDYVRKVGKIVQEEVAMIGIVIIEEDGVLMATLFVVKAESVGVGVESTIREAVRVLGMDIHVKIQRMASKDKVPEVGKVPSIAVNRKVKEKGNVKVEGV